MIATSGPLEAGKTSLKPAIKNTPCLLLAGAAVALGIIFLTVRIRRKALQKRRAVLIERCTDLGELRISFRAIEEIVVHLIKQVKGIRNARAHVFLKEQGLIICLKVKVISEANLLPLVKDLQEKVDEYIQDICGIAVDEVKVLTES